MHERRAVHRTIVVLDVERFGDPRRTDPHELAVRDGLYRSVGEAFQQAGLPWTPDTHEDRGDGILIVLPPEVHKSLLVELLPSALVAALTAHNRAHPDEEGVGKSSLVQAGLLSGLDKAGWAVETVRPRPDLPTALAAALARLSGAPPIVPPSELEAWQDYLSLHGLAAPAEEARKDGKWERAVSVIDQFEETLVRGRDPLLRQLGDLRDGGLLTVVLTLREDSFGALFVSQETFGEQLRRNAVPLRGMDRYELTEAIRLPAEWHGIDVTDPLVEELVEAIRDNPGALPLLEFSLDQMWRALPSHGQLTVVPRVIGRMPGISGCRLAECSLSVSGHLSRVRRPGSAARRDSGRRGRSGRNAGTPEVRLRQ
jgi:hypothetical protein